MAVVTRSRGMNVGYQARALSPDEAREFAAALLSATPMRSRTSMAENARWIAFWFFCAVVAMCMTAQGVYGEHAHCIGYEKHVSDSAEYDSHGETVHHEEWACVKWSSTKK